VHVAAAYNKRGDAAPTQQQQQQQQHWDQ